ncbi:MAG TPA: S8 family peptidase [bacterium]|nr:S8 family peptidase [bacterium]
MSDDERRAVFYKLEHEGAVPLGGTDLKPIVEPSETFTLAVPRSDNLDKLSRKIQDFGECEIERARYERLAAALTTIQPGEPEDRLCQALYDDYEALIRQDWVICEIEIISLEQGRRQQQRELRQIRTSLVQAFESGVHGNVFEQEEIKATCRAVIRCTGALFQQLVEGREWQRRIWWFDARPEFETFHSTLREFAMTNLQPCTAPSESAPVVCIVDSGVTRGNPFLKPVVREDLLRSFLTKSPDSPHDEHGHGSGVASLAAYYALNLESGASNEGKVWIASARILDSDNAGEEDRLLSKVLQEVVRFFVDHGVRIFNLSVSILNRKWNQEAKRTVTRKSWVARTIDRLTREHNIIFVVATGNLSLMDVRDYLQNNLPYPDYLYEEDSRLFDPAQAALALTVGAISPGTLIVGPDGSARAIAPINGPAPFTRCGPGMNKEIKPELVDYGGNYVLDVDGEVVRSNPGTDVMMASHQLTPAIAHDCGTSFAAPRVAHKLALVLADLEAMGLTDISASLLKAFIVNSATYGGLDLDGIKDQEPKHFLNVVGYGKPDDNRATYCDSYSALLFYRGKLERDTVAYFDIPVPSELAASSSGRKRLTITVVYAPEVQRCGLERYLATSFKWRLFRGDVSRDDIIAFMSAEEGDDSLEHERERPGEIPGKYHRYGIRLRSRGTIQHDVMEWTEHRERYSDNTYTLAIAAYEKWGRRTPPEVPYAVVVRLEDTTESTQVYSAVQNILAQIEVRARTRT